MTGNTASNTIYLTAKAIYDWVTTLLLASLTGKTTPVNADGVPIMDSAASNVMKFLSFTNLKAFLKTYFDTLYPSGSGTSTGTNTGDNATNTQYSGLAASKLDATAYDDATVAEVNTGTSTAKYVSPDSLSGSNTGTRVVNILVSDPQ